VAIKKIHPMSKSSHAKYTLREVLLMRHLGKCENVIALSDLYAREKADEIYLVMDYLDADLHRVIQSKQTLSVEHLRYFMWQIFRGIQFMHAHGVLHRDLKPSNLLVNRNCALKIGDFGLARVAPDAASGLMTQHVVTRWYRSPELMLCPDGKYTAAVDLWSVGCILGEVLGRRPMFPGKSSMQQLNLIFDVIGSPGSSELDCVKTEQARRYVRSMGFKRRVDFAKKFPNAEPEAISLLSQLLVFVPAKRLTVEQAMAHPFFNKLRSALTPAQRAVSTSPSKSGFDFGDFEFEAEKLSTPQIRKLIMQEVGFYAAKQSAAKVKAANAKGSAASSAKGGGATSKRASSSSSSSSSSSAAAMAKSKDPLRAAGAAAKPAAASAAARGSAGSGAPGSAAAAAAAAAAMAVATGTAVRKVESRKQSPAMAVAKAIAVAHNAAVAALAAARISARSVTMVAVRNASTAADDAAFASAVAAAAAFDCTFIAHVVAVATLAATAARGAATAAAAAALSAKISIPSALSSTDVQRRHDTRSGKDPHRVHAGDGDGAHSGGVLSSRSVGNGLLRASSLSTDRSGASGSVLSSERGSLVSAISASSSGAPSVEPTWEASSSVEQRASAWNLSRPMSSAAKARRIGSGSDALGASASASAAIGASTRPSTAAAPTTARASAAARPGTAQHATSSGSSSHRSRAEEHHWKGVVARRTNRSTALRPSTSSARVSSSRREIAGHAASSSSSSIYGSSSYGKSSSSSTSATGATSGGHSSAHYRPSTTSSSSRAGSQAISQGSARGAIMQRRAEAEQQRRERNRDAGRSTSSSASYSATLRAKAKAHAKAKAKAAATAAAQPAQPKGTTVPVPFSFNSNRKRGLGKAKEPRQWGELRSRTARRAHGRTDLRPAHSSSSRSKHGSSSGSSYASNSIAQQHLFGRTSGGSGGGGSSGVSSATGSSAKKVTVPSSPRFSRMSWQRQQQARKWGRSRRP
jgi:serine/threonine protein kinase